MEMYKYKVSVVMAVYNVEPFIREAIDSVIAQDIGFENIQLILVDDGSPDGSGAICDEYAAKYPENIVVIHKENGGVSSARNAGLDRVEGEFVNFMDADDKLGSNAASLCYAFMKQHEDETDLVAFPVKYFDGRQGEHRLNDKFKKGTRVIDLNEEWLNLQYFVHSVFIKATCVRDLRYDIRLAIGEDQQFIHKALMPKQTLGVHSKPVYWYRVRSTGEASAVDGRRKNKKNYLPMLRYLYMHTITQCLEKYGKVPEYYQYCVADDLQWHIKPSIIPEGVLTTLEKEKYFEEIGEILQYIDDDVIDAVPLLKREHKLRYYQLKYKNELMREIQREDICIRTKNNILLNASDSVIKLEFYRNEGNILRIDGSLEMLSGLLESCKVLAKVGDDFYEAYSYGARDPVSCCEEKEVLNPLTFKVEIPLKSRQKQNLEFYCETERFRIPLHNLQYGRYFPISGKYVRNFYATKEWILTQDNETLMLSPRRIGSFLWHELQLCRELLATKHKIARNSVISRLLLHVLKPFKRKPLWLISDRPSKAGDNGEAFFRYVRKNHPEIDARFVINGDCPDYAAMQKIGPVVKKDSFVHKILHLLSDCVISSHGEVDIYNPFYRSYEPYRNLLAKDKYVFLQHGITKDDLSGWLKRSIKNFSGFITAAIPEYASILDGAYEYNERQVWLTGFPRFDRLYREEEKWITIMPTWRAYLMGTHDLHNGTRVLKAGTENSEYVAFYNSLLNNERLCAAARQYGYQLKFLPHPEMQTHLDVFEKNSAVDYLGREMEYREIYAKSNLVITDYSSAVFDFAYLRKPVMYLHFDADEFFGGNHVYTKGYFDYERDGFGEVEYDLDSAIDRIIEYMENGCQLKDKYRERIDNFFAFNDQNNCQRVFEKIMELQQ